MKSYQELIEERKKELMRGAATSTASAPKALSVAEAIEKRKQELAKDVTTSVPTAAASAPSGVLDPVGRARRLETPATQEVSKPYSRRGNVEARNIAAEPDVLSGRAQRFQLMNELEAELPFYKGTAEAEASYQQKLEDAQRSGQVSTLDSFDPQAVDDEMAGIAPYGSFTDGIGGQIEAGARLLNQPGTVGAKWRESDRSAEAGRKIREYLTTGKIAVGGPSQAFVNSGGYFPDQGQKYLEGSAAEAYIRDLTSKNEDTALVQAFDRDAGVVAKAFTNTLSQPEQLYSLAGGIAGGAVGMPGVGAAVGMTPLLEKALYSKYFQNIQLGIPNEESWNNALATLPVEGLTEWVGGRFGATGGISRAAGISAAEEASAEVLGIGVDAASAAFVDPRFKGNLPRTFGEGAERVAVSSLSGGMGGAAIRSIPEFAKGAASMFSPRKATPLAEGAARARETLQAAGAFADGAAIPDAPDTGSTISFDPAINEALAAGQNEGGATAPPAPTQKAPVAPPVKPQGQVSREASVAAGQRILADLKTDPTLGVPEADRPRVLHERTKVYEAQEQAKLDDPKEVSKTLKLVRDIGKTVRTEPNILAGVEAPTNRILTNVTNGIAPLSATELAVRKLASEGRAPTTRQPIAAPTVQEAPTPAPVKAQETPLQKAGRVIDERRTALEQASTQNRLDEGTVKKLQREEEDLRLTLQEDEKRKANNVLPTPEVPYLSEREVTSISEKRGELREQLEKHRAAVGYGNQLNDLDTSLSKLGESDSDVIALAAKLQTPTQPQAFVPAPAQAIKNRLTPKPPAPTAPSAPVANQVPIVQSATLGEASTTIGATKALEALEPIRVTQPEQQSQQGEMTNGMQGQEEGRRNPSNQEVTDNAPVGTGQAAGSMRGATNARAAMIGVGNSLEPGVSSELRRTANELKNSPNTQDTKVVVMTADEAVAEGSHLRKVAADGTVTAGKAAYERNSDTIYLQENATIEDVVHEAAHSATVKAIAALEQGVVNDPESMLALENLKAAVNRLGEITAADLPGVPADIVARIQYAARNPQEAVAVLRSSPETAKALRDSKIMVDVKADRKTKIPVKMPILKAIINSIASIVGKQVFKTQHRDQVVRTVERMLLADSVIQSSKTLERTDVRGIKMSDVRAGDTASRLTGTDAKRGVAPTKTDNAPPNPALPKALQDIPRGLPGLVDKILPKIQRLVSYKMGASPTVYSMVRDNIGGRNLKDWQTENLLAETRDAMRKSLGKRAGMYNDELVKALRGQNNTLPAEAKAAVASVRLLIDGLTIKAMALGAMSPNNIVSAIKRIGSYVHDDYKAWKMGPGEWQSLQESPRGDGSNNAADLIMSVLPKMMQDIALPADAQLDALGALAQGKGKTAKKRAQAELDIMLGRYGFTQANATVDQQVAFLKKVRDSFTPDSFREHAAELARKLMNPKGIVLDESIPFKPFSVDATGLKNKTKVPEWQKELWGKYEEYDAIVINTVRMLGGIVDKFASLEGYKQQLIDEGTIVQNKVPHGYTVLKDNDPLVYGPLNGYAIRDRDVALVGALAKQGVQGASAFLQGLTIGGAFGDALSKASSLSKIQAIVLAPDAWLFNATSTVMVGTLASGHPLAIAQHGKKAADFASREAFAGMGRTTKAVETDIQKVFEILFKRGVMGDSALAQDLRSDLAERVIDEAYKDAPAVKRMWHNAKRGAQRGVDFGGRALSFGDTMGKVLSVYVRVPYLRNIYPNKTWDEILTIAADETADSLPSMSRSIPILKAMGRQGVVMPFAGYFAETFRNTLTDLGLGFKYQLMGLKLLSEGKAKEGTAAALYGTMIHAGNIARHGIVWALHSGIAASIYGMYQLALTAFSDDDEEPDDEAKKISAQVESARAIMEDPEKYKAFREMVPDDVTGDVVPLREIEPGVFSFTTTQRLDMYTTGSALTALERGDWSKKEAWQDAGVAMLSPFNQFSLVAKPVVDLLKGKEGAEWDLAASLLIPAPVKRADRIIKAAEKGYEMTPFEKSMHMGGMTVSFIDVRQELANKMQGLASDVNDKMRAVTDSLDPNRKDVTERYTGTNKFSEEFSQAILAQAQMFKEFAPVIERAKFFGLSTQDIVAAAKLNGVSLSDTDLIGIIDGKFTPTSAAKVITQKWQTELKAASQNPRQSARINAYYKAALEDAKKVDEAALIMLKSEGMNVRGQQE